MLNLQERIVRMAQQQPAFVDITWTAGGKTGSLSIQLARFCREHGMNAQLHISAAGMDEASVRAALDAAREAGIVNILALRGDVPSASEAGEDGDARHPSAALPFPHAVDLVRFIRRHYGDAFCIGVAGYPEGHVDSVSYESDLQHLAEKVSRLRLAPWLCPAVPGSWPAPSAARPRPSSRLLVRARESPSSGGVDSFPSPRPLPSQVFAGGEYILTQQFFNVGRFEKFLADCKRVGAHKPSRAAPRARARAPAEGRAGGAAACARCCTRDCGPRAAVLRPALARPEPRADSQRDRFSPCRAAAGCAQASTCQSSRA